MPSLENVKWFSIGAIRGVGYGLIVSMLIILILIVATQNMENKSGRTGFLALIDTILLIFGVFIGIGVFTLVMSIKLGRDNMRAHVNTDGTLKPFNCPSKLDK